MAILNLILSYVLGASPTAYDAPATSNSEGFDPFRGANFDNATSASFIILGDTGTGDRNQELVSAAAKKICDGWRCDFAILLGDNIYEFGPHGPEDPQFHHKFEQPYRDFDMPFFLVQGNHDNSWMLPGDGGLNRRGSFEVAYANSGRSRKFTMPARYYTFTFPPNADVPLMEFFALDTNSLAHSISDFTLDLDRYNEEQRHWLKKHLKKSKAVWKFAMGHHPYVSNGMHGNAGNYDAGYAVWSTVEKAVQLLQDAPSQFDKVKKHGRKLINKMLFEAEGEKLTDEQQKAKAVLEAALRHDKHKKNSKAISAYLKDWVRGKFYKGFFEDEVCGKVDAFLSGHDHTLQWLAPIHKCDPKMSFILSGAGAKVEVLQDEDRNPTFWQKGSSLGFFHMTVTADGAVARAFTVSNVTGEVVEAYSGSL